MIPRATDMALLKRLAVTLTGVVLASGCAEADQHLEAPASAMLDSYLSVVDWRFVGPYRGGRVIAVAGSTKDPLVFYFGAAHGGVWKTDDAGQFGSSQFHELAVTQDSQEEDASG